MQKSTCIADPPQRSQCPRKEVSSTQRKKKKKVICFPVMAGRNPSHQQGEQLATLPPGQLVSSDPCSPWIAAPHWLTYPVRLRIYTPWKIPNFHPSFQTIYHFMWQAHAPKGLGLAHWNWGSPLTVVGLKYSSRVFDELPTDQSVFFFVYRTRFGLSFTNTVCPKKRERNSLELFL